MAGSVNKVILVGNLGKDPEIRRTQDGRPIANLSIATSETWRDKGTGERKVKTEWHRVVIFNEGLCKVAEQYLKKGAKVYIEGQGGGGSLGGDDAGGDFGSPGPSSAPPRRSVAAGARSSNNDMDDDIPF